VHEWAKVKLERRAETKVRSIPSLILETGQMGQFDLAQSSNVKECDSLTLWNVKERDSLTLANVKKYEKVHKY
jgi:hypothetical protein